MPSSKIVPHFDSAFSFISTELTKGNVLVHCAASNSRVTVPPIQSTAVVIAYLIREGKTFTEALELVGR